MKSLSSRIETKYITISTPRTPVKSATSVILSVLFLLSPLGVTLTPVFADGLFEEMLSASFGERKANLVIKMTPPVITTETLSNKTQKPIIEFLLSDTTTNKTFTHVTYFITIEKAGKKPLSDWFHDHSGNLRI